MNKKTHIFKMAEMPEFEGIEQLEYFGRGQIIPTFKGWYLALKRAVVIRLFPTALVRDVAGPVGLKNLAQKMIQSRHPGGIEWLEFREINLKGTAYYYLVAEWFSDISLKTWVGQYGALNEENVLLVIEHAANVLEYFWNDCRIAHGNLKPRNILIDNNDALKIDGLGLRELLGLITPSETSVGASAFMAPELLAGRNQPDEITDIYALGKTAVCLLTSPVKSAEGAREEVVALKSVSLRISMSDEMSALIRRMTAERREERYQSWSEIRAVVKGIGDKRKLAIDQNRKTQTIRIPSSGKDFTQIFKIAAKPDNSRMPKENVIPETPVSVRDGVQSQANWAPGRKPGMQMKDIIVSAGGVVVISVFLLLAYLRFVKGIDIFDSFRNRVATASYVLFNKDDQVVVSRDDLNYLVADSEKLAASSRQTSIPQADTTPIIETNRKVQAVAVVGTVAGNKEPPLDGAQTSGRVTVITPTVVEPVEDKAQVDKTVVVRVMTEESQSSNDIVSATGGETSKTQADMPGRQVDQAPITNPSAVKAAAAAKSQTEVGASNLADVTNQAEEVAANAQQNPAAEQYRLGNCALKGEGTNKNVGQAISYFKKAADMGYSPAYCRLGDIYGKGLSGAANPPMAMTMYKKAVGLNSIEAKGQLALYYFSKAKNSPQNVKEMAQWLNAAATNDHLNAATDEERNMLVQIYLLYGDCLTNGRYMKKNAAAAAKWYEKAAGTDDPEGLFQFGCCLLKGLGLERDESKGYELLLKSAEQDHALSAWMVGECLLAGTGVEQDKRKAHSWFCKAAGNVPEAAFRKGEYCLNQKNYAEAFHAFVVSAERGHGPAIEKVIECYENNLGVKNDPNKVKMWRAKLQQFKAVQGKK